MVMGDMEMNTDLLVIGAGPAGYEAAFRAADSGLDVTLVDPFATPGGNYLYTTTIPSAMSAHLSATQKRAKRGRKLGLLCPSTTVDIKAAQQYRDNITAVIADRLKKKSKNKSVLFIQGRARFEDDQHAKIAGGVINRIHFKHALIATGSKPDNLLKAPVRLDGRILNSQSALALREIPETLLVIGGGPTGIEIGSLYAEFGSRVTLIEKKSHPLGNLIDQDISNALLERLMENFAEIHLNAELTSITENETSVVGIFSTQDKSHEKQFDAAVVAIGQTPNVVDLGLENTLVELDGENNILTNTRQQTASQSIYSAGDVCGGPMLASKAALQGQIAADNICGIKNSFDTQILPTVLNTTPPLGYCGLSETEAKALSIPVISQIYTWDNSDFSLVKQQAGGITKLIADTSGRLVGGAILGSGVEKLLGEITHAIEMGALAEDLALTLHPYSSVAATLSQTAQQLVEKIIRTNPI
jgi:dihydrolipoamide dehydrogenase